MTSGTYAPGRIFFFKGQKDGFAKGVPIEEKAPEGADKDPYDTKTTMATSELLDFDGDGDLDFIVGCAGGQVYLSRNEGTKTAPRFGLRVPLETVDKKPIRVCQKSDPVLVDWDSDGVRDLLVGDEAGDVTFFRGRADGRFEAGRSIFSGLALPEKPAYAAVKKSLGTNAPTPGYRLRLNVVDWNGDGRLDLLIGNCELIDDKVHGFVYLLLAEAP